LSPDEKFLVVGVSGVHVGVWDIISGNMVTLMKGNTASCTNIAWSPNQKYIACGNDSTVHMWTLEKQVCQNAMQTYFISCCAEYCKTMTAHALFVYLI
jgi:WD40 repeat protein